MVWDLFNVILRVFSVPDSEGEPVMKCWMFRGDFFLQNHSPTLSSRHIKKRLNKVHTYMIKTDRINANMSNNFSSPEVSKPRRLGSEPILLVLGSTFMIYMPN